MRHLLTLAIVLLCLLVVVQVSNAQISNSKHNLSSSSTTTGPKSTNTNEVCVFCHTPHSQSATTVLWNRTASGATYTVYSSPSMEQTVPQPGSASKNCLSCHDGTVAFNSLINSPGSGVGTPPTMSQAAMSGWDSLGTHLSNDHPVGLVYTTHQSTDSDLRAASLVNGKPVVQNGSITLPLVGTATATATLECTSCHDPHGVTSVPLFQRVANTASQMCFTCHDK
ncbi:MAG: cytochrome c3 family protein [Bacteroidota bacterium]